MSTGFLIRESAFLNRTFYYFPDLFSFLTFLKLKLHDPRYQPNRQLLIDRKLHRPLASFVFGEFFLELFIASRSRVNTRVIFKTCEVDHVAIVQCEGWNT